MQPSFLLFFLFNFLFLSPSAGVTFFLNKISFASVIEASFITLGLQIFGGKRK